MSAVPRVSAFSGVGSPFAGDSTTLTAGGVVGPGPGSGRDIPYATRTPAPTKPIANGIWTTFERTVTPDLARDFDTLNSSIEAT
jgi:hypothetical protein